MQNSNIYELGQLVKRGDDKLFVVVGNNPTIDLFNIENETIEHHDITNFLFLAPSKHANKEDRFEVVSGTMPYLSSLIGDEAKSIKIASLLYKTISDSESYTLPSEDISTIDNEDPSVHIMILFEDGDVSMTKSLFVANTNGVISLHRNIHHLTYGVPRDTTSPYPYSINGYRCRIYSSAKESDLVRHTKH